MKTYTINNLKQISKEQGYKLAALENSQGERLQSFNNLKTKIDTHLNTITSRLKSELYPDGVYYVCMAQSINKTKAPDKYPVVKGQLKPEHLAEHKPVVTVIEKQENVLTWESALAMQKQISDLQGQVTQLKFENNLLQSELDNLDDDDNSGLNEGNEVKAPNSFLSETIPSMLPILDRYFDLEEKKLNLQQLKFQQKQRPASPLRKPITVGSQEHLNIIEHYYNTKQEGKLDAELDKLEAANEELYKQVCVKLGIVDEEEEEQNEQ